VAVFDEVLDAGDHRRHQYDPDAHGVPQGRDVEYHYHNAYHGSECLDFAGHGGGYDAAVLHGYEPQAGDGELARQHDHQRPGRHTTPLDENQHRRRDQQLVSQRVDKFAEIGDLIVVPRYIAVDPVGEARDGEYHQ